MIRIRVPVSGALVGVGFGLFTTFLVGLFGREAGSIGVIMMIVGLLIYCPGLNEGRRGGIW